MEAGRKRRVGWMHGFRCARSSSVDAVPVQQHFAPLIRIEERRVARQCPARGFQPHQSGCFERVCNDSVGRPDHGHLGHVGGIAGPTCAVPAAKQSARRRPSAGCGLRHVSPALSKIRHRLRDCSQGSPCLCVDPRRVGGGVLHGDCQRRGPRLSLWLAGRACPSRSSTQTLQASPKSLDGFLWPRAAG